MNALFAFLHHLAAFLLVSTLVVEMALLKGPLDPARARQLQRTDLLYGIAAGLVVALGFLRVYYFEKGSEYYFHNLYFMLKLGLFAVIGALSVYPTVVFLKWGKSLKQGVMPVIPDDQLRNLRKVLMAELAGVVGMLCCAALMARGYGML
ncbi:MAG: DUF2214 family protein [Fluviicoccus sp.]|uniref:DUF2214 family protein n=1 Tax=Fluviicoccus sp. TaxID=2003552 RepID=UPI00271C6701|nr:DUF2214 family protein [Fluviicoccus sp.]MDO8330517.1 DUF2214 family protein [Fluviicoccus sp.]